MISFSLGHAKLAARMLASAFAGYLAMQGVANAEAFVLTKQTCTTLNCNALTLPGIINGHPTEPTSFAVWTAQFAAQASSCMRFQVTSAQSSRNLAMTVVAPNGLVFTNNDGGVSPCTTCPKVVVGASANGYYTVVVAHSTAGAGVDTTFTLRAGLYNTGNNPNCLSPTAGK